jgi:putative chitinase
MPALDGADIAEQCVRQGVFFGVEPHYLLGIAQLRSGMSSDDDGDQKGLFRLTQAEWDANSNDDSFDIHFAPTQISSPSRQCAVFGLMTNRTYTAFVSANNRNPSTQELYLKQFPGADPSGLQDALNKTAPLIGPASQAVLDDPQVISTLPGPDATPSGPAVITPAPIPPVAGAGAGMLTLAMLQRRWPAPPALAAIVQGMAATSAVLSGLGINTPLRMAHFMAQISEETGCGREMTESLMYSAEGLMRTWPNRFPTIGSTQGFVRSEKALGNKVYNGRMGNQVGTDDGFNFRGRGCLQITGRDSYDNIGKSIGLDLVNNPDLVNAPENVLRIAGTEFVKSGCLPDCDQDNVIRVSARVNVGSPTADPRKINGLAEREKQLGFWKQEFGIG